jgi:hypothetical protein
MPWSHSPELQAAVRQVVEGTTTSIAAIAAATGVGRSTVSDWIAREGWTRPEGASTRRPVTREERAAATRVLDLGASLHDVGLLMRRHPEVVRRWRTPRDASAAAEAEEAPRAPPAHAAALYEALTAGAIGRDELVRRAPQALALVMAETLVARLDPDRKARALARLAAIAASMPADAPARGALPDDDLHAGPATYDETNALLEEFAVRLAAFDAAEEARGLLGDPVAEDAAGPA